MTVVLTGSGLTLDQLLQVARAGARVSLDPAAIERMRASRAIVDRALQRDERVYGLTTGVAALKRVRVPPERMEAFNRALVREHRIAHGPAAPAEQVRAALVRLANGFASGTPGVRPELAEQLIATLNNGTLPTVRLLGSVGISDLAQHADLADGIFHDRPLQAGEALALLNNNAFSTGAAALALADTRRLLEGMDAAAALSLEGFAANLTILHPAVAATRPYPGLQATIQLLRSILSGSRLWQEGAARNLQDPLTFRCIPQLLGAARDALAYAEAQLAIELNASQGNPIVVPTEQRVLSVGNFDVVPLAAALDFVRIALAPVVTASAERSVKLLEAPWSGLRAGLSPEETPEPGLGELGLAAIALASEARLLAQPVSYELASSSEAEGIEDRATMAPLAARQLADMVGLAERVIAIELVVAAQAAELRAGGPLGKGTQVLVDRLRERIPFFRGVADFPVDLEPVRELIRSGLPPG